MNLSLQLNGFLLKSLDFPDQATSPHFPGLQDPRLLLAGWVRASSCLLDAQGCGQLSWHRGAEGAHGQLSWHRGAAAPERLENEIFQQFRTGLKPGKELEE